MAATRFIALHVNRDKDASARGCGRIICFPISNRRLERFPHEQNSSFMPWRLIDKFPQNMNGFRYVSENRGKFWICSYRQPGSVIIFSAVSGHVETVALLARTN